MKLSHELLRTLFNMAWVVEARDPYTGGHLWRVSQFSALLAEVAGHSPLEQNRVALGGFLHDMGKVGVPDAILNKTGPLTDEEYAIIKTHPDVGHRLLRDHPLAKLTDSAVRDHHERPDGTGYPRGLEPGKTSLDARIVGICDAFDAMTSSRPYRAGMPIETALTIIEKNLGTQFDRALGETFVALGRRGMLDHIAGHSEPGIPLQDCPNCGPTIVMTRTHDSGDAVYCRVCGGEARVKKSGGELYIEPTGNTGGPEDLEPAIDDVLITNLVRASGVLLDDNSGLLGRFKRTLSFGS